MPYQLAAEVPSWRMALYTGVCVAELVGIRLADVDLDAWPHPYHRRQGRQGRQGPLRALPRLVQRDPRPLHIAAQHDKGALFLFESSWKKP